MKASKIILPIVLIIALGFSWFSFFSGTLKTQIKYNECISEAENSTTARLYEQAIEYYKKALEYKNSGSIYDKIKETYDMLYDEEHTAFIRNLYLEDMALASEAFPKKAEYWEMQVMLYMEANNFSKAYTAVNKAINNGAKSENLDSLYNQLLYMTKVDYKLYYDYKTALNGYISVFDGNNWIVLNETGEAITSKYKFKGLYVNNIDARILDSEEITRARFNFDVEDAGFYNAKADLMPIKIDGKWKYVNLDGDFLPGDFDIAGSFFGDEAVACKNGKWVLIDKKGKQKPLDNFEDIKLDLYGCHIQGEIIIAKENGKYSLYDLNLKKVGNFSADDIDICINGDLIAFKNGEKWGFVDTKGKVVVEPEYSRAKSFSNGYAAVCNNVGLWGFINSEFKLVIDYEYIDTLYFNSNETCLVSKTENTMQLLHFMFE